MARKPVENPPVENPKESAGRAKAALRFTPPSAIVELGRVHEIGAWKYGAFNWGEAGVVASTYREAIERHLLQWFTGEDVDPESGCSHLAHVMACAAILIDCGHLGVLEDDRPVGKTAPVGPILDAMARLKLEQEDT